MIGFGKKIKKYLVELILIAAAVVTTVISLVLLSKTYQENYQSSTTQSSIEPISSYSQTTIFVDVSGSVNKPGLYEASNGARLKEMIDKAGGLTIDADKDFFSRNSNLSRVVSDQEKIYVPSTWEVSNGYFIEEPKTIAVNFASQSTNQAIATSDLININSATIEELDKLPGVGAVVGQKIIDNRPFGALEELINKKVVNKNVYENIKNLISI
ncbi:helix-hairpin-helix domain-containing protein [Patescibacteria group bacterium]|nr:helix-hairpin-helix domain-containing protein [Patescibacteria group bacterium]